MKNPEHNRLQTTKFDHTINYGETYYFLCEVSERLLVASLRKTAYLVVIVDRCRLVAKMMGKLTALAIDSNSGFTKGHWYTPATLEERLSINKTFDHGISTLQTSGGTWDYMRPAVVKWKQQSPILIDEKLITNAALLLETSKKYVKNLPPHFGEHIDYGQSELMDRCIFRLLVQNKH